MEILKSVTSERTTTTEAMSNYIAEAFIRDVYLIEYVTDIGGYIIRYKKVSDGSS